MVLDVDTSPTTYNDGDWHHVAFWADMADTGNRGLYIDDADASPTWNTYTDSTLGMGFRYANIFNRYDGFYQNGDLYLAEIVVDTRNYLDLSVTANRRLFITAGGAPVTTRSGWPSTLDGENYANTGDAVSDFIENVGTASASGFYTEQTTGTALAIADGPTTAGSP